LSNRKRLSGDVDAGVQWVSGWPCQLWADHSLSTRLTRTDYSSARVATPIFNTLYCVRQIVRHALRPRLSHVSSSADHADHWPV